MIQLTKINPAYCERCGTDKTQCLCGPSAPGSCSGIRDGRGLIWCKSYKCWASSHCDTCAVGKRLKQKNMNNTNKERLNARIAGAKAALEGRKMDANTYDETDDLHFEWLAAWTDTRMEMMRRSSQNS